MLKDKQNLEQLLEVESLKLVFDKVKCASIYNFTEEKYNIPQSLMSDMLTQRVPLSECSEYLLFCMLTAINHLAENKKEKNSETNYFTEQEIKTYLTSKFKENKIKFPFTINHMVQVSHDQWIGSINIKFLMELRKGQLINYNVNAQRTMQRIVNGEGDEFYKISLNKNAVSSIKNSYEKEYFIPNTITLNIPTETEFDYNYDNDSHSLTINKLEHFDLSDGYHRYIALSQIYDMNPSFNYQMEIRIVNFSEDKAKQFIFQEDQKTKMRKLDSNALNMTNAANIVATRLNENHQCNLQGLISRNEGIIPFGEFASLIEYFYFKNIKNQSQEKMRIIEITKELINNWNMVTEHDQKYLEKKYSFKDLTIVMYIFNFYSGKNKDTMCNTIDKVLKKADNLDNKKFYTKTPKKSIMNEIQDLIEEVLNNV